MADKRDYELTSEDLRELISKLSSDRSSAEIDAGVADLAGGGLPGPAAAAREERARLSDLILQYEKLLTMAERGWCVFQKDMYDHAWDCAGYITCWDVVSERDLDSPIYVGSPDVKVRIPSDALSEYALAVESDEFKSFSVCTAFDRPAKDLYLTREEPQVPLEPDEERLSPQEQWMRGIGGWKVVEDPSSGLVASGPYHMTLMGELHYADDYIVALHSWTSPEPNARAER